MCVVSTSNNIMFIPAAEAGRDGAPSPSILLIGELLFPLQLAGRMLGRELCALDQQSRDSKSKLAPKEPEQAT